MYQAARGGRRGVQFSNWLPVSNAYLNKINGTTVRLADWGKDVSPELVEYGRAYALWSMTTTESHTKFNGENE